MGRKSESLTLGDFFGVFYGKLRGKKWTIVVSIIYGSDHIMLGKFLYALLTLTVQNCLD